MPSDGAAAGGPRANDARVAIAAIAFLTADEAAYITGQVLGVDGGLAMM